MTTYTPTSRTGPGPFVEMAAGDETDVETGVSLVSTNESPPIEDESYGIVQVDGSISGVIGIELDYNVATARVSTVTIGMNGTVEGVNRGIIAKACDLTNYGLITSSNTQNAAIAAIQLSGSQNTKNYGTIKGTRYGIAEYGYNTGAIQNATLINYGTITSTGAAGESSSIYVANDINATVSNRGTINAPAVSNGVDAVSADMSSVIKLYNYVSGVINGSVVLGSSGSLLVNRGALTGTIVTGSGSNHIFNFGTITGMAELGLYPGGDGSVFDNAGTIDGGVVLEDNSSDLVFNSEEGQVSGTITIGMKGGTVVAGTNGGSVEGGAGKDIIEANQSQTAADAGAHFVLDGGRGINALYGGGAFNAFKAGDAAGGHNQIHGGASQMSDVAGYANNSIDFSQTPSGQSVYVDLLSGHNAYLYANANHSGALTFEDSIQNVPNVIGSAGGDLIRADNGTDIIQGGAGGDILYAGTGFDTFVYSGYADSNTVHGYDTISGFATGKDKLDLSALNSDASHLAIASSSSSTTLYLEKTAGTFNSATDLAISFTGAHAIAASDVVF